jgi:malate permease and related proteins
VPAALGLLLDVVLPVFVVIAIGGWIGRRFALDVAVVNRVALFAAVPALAFRTLADLELAAAEVTRLLAGYGLFALALAALAWLIGRTWPAPARRTLVGTSLLANAANLNLPVVLFAFGEAGFERALVLYVVTSLLMFSVGPSLVGRARSLRATLHTVMTFPVLWAAVAGLAANAWHVELPQTVTRAVALLADAAIPLVLLTLGLQLARTRRLRPTVRVWTGVALKLLAGPLVAGLAGRLVGLTGLDLAVLVTFGAMPTAVNTAMLAIEFEGDTAQVGDTVVVGTALALLTLPVVLTLLQRVG